ncbi:29229_t:CDS:2 [Gigaspora margarita]|uniref:29229_t:CDS:1 n=1 Tax=Gigaspora margarita TaxID=4874 RepID=A0ABM8W6L1_GIGMA|nr:29229_t:CDS:2 [Gigaspora margarita]
MGKNKPTRYRLTQYIEVLKEKSNEYNRFAICKSCKKAKGNDYAYLYKFVNTKWLVKSHLKNCVYFKNQKGEDEAEKILNDTDNKKSKKCKYKSKDNESSDQSQDDLGAYKGPLDLHTILKELFNELELKNIKAIALELEELKKLYDATSTTFLLSHNNKKHTLIVQDTDNEDDYIEIEEDEDNDDISLWTSISDNDTNEDALSDSELTDNFNETLVNQEYIVKDRRANEKIPCWSVFH